MVTGTTAKVMWTKLCQAPPEWFTSPEGKRLVKKCVKLVRDRDGKEQARQLLYLTWLARVTP